MFAQVTIRISLHKLEIMNKNETLQKDVQDAIKWEPSLKAAEIGVIVASGIVTLTGTVDSYTKKNRAESAAKNVVGVKAVVEEIKVNFEGQDKNSDQEIAANILSAFKWNWDVPNDCIKVKVESGWVTLEGEVGFNYQKEAAKKAVSELVGVKNVANNIIVTLDTQDDVEQKDIERALSLNWSVSNQDIVVHVVGNRVTLNGSVASLYQKDEAGRIALNAPGVWDVQNDIEVSYDRLRMN